MAKIYYPRWRGAMHKYPKLKWEDQGLEVLIRPSGWRGWSIVRNMILYLPGDVLRFMLFAVKTKAEGKRYNYTWVLKQHFPDGQEKIVQSYNDSFTIIAHQKAKPFLAGTARIITPGLHTLLLTLTTDGKKPAIERQTMVYITALSGGKLLWALYSVLFMGIGAVIRHFFFG